MVADPDPVFDAAQLAARDGRYREVVEILGAALESGQMEASEVVVAYANRGIAYSLLGAYELARQDLLRANELDPTHNLTLNHLGLLAEQVDEDFSAAAAWYEQAVERGFAASQVNLANLYRDGKGLRKRPSRAFELLSAAASQQYVMAYAPLGEMYLLGEGTDRNYAAAVEWFTRGATEGVVSAHYFLGVVYERGAGVLKDPARAAHYYRVAALQGHGRAQNSLGYLYRAGAGVPQDYLEAAKWYRLAADQEIADAMNRLAWLLATCPVEEVCNGMAAIELAMDAVRTAPTASHLDTLAAAYARSGQFDLAVATMERVLSSLTKSSAEREKFNKRLNRYRNGIPSQL